MDKQLKTRIWTIITLTLVVVITIALVQLVGVGIDMLRKKANVDINQQTTGEAIPSASQATSTDSVKRCEIDALYNFDKCEGYNQVSIYTEGIETPSTYINNAKAELSKAGRKIVVNGEIEDAYIYIKAGATDENGNFSSIKKSFDGIWFYLQDGHFNGGILDLSKSIYGKPSEITELLYNIKEIPIAKDNNNYRLNKYETVNLLGELKGDRLIGALVSTARYGKILDLSIYYKCKSQECSIELK